jgi:hypothetical protein
MSGNTHSRRERTGNRKTKMPEVTKEREVKTGTLV